MHFAYNHLKQRQLKIGISPPIYEKHMKKALLLLLGFFLHYLCYLQILTQKFWFVQRERNS